MNWADEAISVTQFVGSAAGLALKIGGPALPIVEFVAGFVPGLAPAIQVLSVAAPILQKIAAAAPVVESVIKTAKPTIDALQAASPSLVTQLKELYAVAVNHDPARPETSLMAGDVNDEDLKPFLSSIFERSLFTPQDARFVRVVIP